MSDLIDLTPAGDEPAGEPGELIRREVGRLAHHPREELMRLRLDESEGESGATPFIVIAAVAPLLIALVIAVALAASAVYYLSG
jgi:hypothetical protein